MAKRINKYRAYTVAELIARTDIPSNSSYIVSGSTYMDVYNITTVDISNVINVDSHSVHELCTSHNINKWSAFSPWIRTVSGSGMNGVIQHNLPTGTTGSHMGDFAGYNHTAVTPSYYNSNRTETISTTAGATVQFDCDFTLGELVIAENDIQGVSEIEGIVFTVWDGGTLKGYQVRDINAGKDEWRAGTSLGFTVSFTGPSSNYTDYDCKLYFINSSSTYSYNSSEICQVFSDVLPQYVKRVRVQTSSTETYISSPYSVTIISSGWTLSTGHLSFTDMSTNHSYATGLRVQCWVEQYNVNTNGWDRVTSVTTIRDINRNQPYTANSSIASSYNVHIWTNMDGSENTTLPVPSYDYRLYLYFDGV